RRARPPASRAGRACGKDRPRLRRAHCRSAHARRHSAPVPQRLDHTATREGSFPIDSSAVAVAAVRSPAEYENRLRDYIFERYEEIRVVYVGEKEVSEQAEIVARYGDLFTRDQLAALREAEEGSQDGGEGEGERLYRLRKTCEDGLMAAALIEQVDELENAELAARLDFR